ncbi:hypothetical protein D9757_005200 [Collybiopsis confluens]|uniref:F-box domain-containing protein n=1 Tax=Collybiopsis confluens TaxID=2823264 RepID=A0A8H5HW26_9AGAR|nr:hypothetical protein D9757_005200 [Collybiopsis confluens]
MTAQLPTEIWWKILEFLPLHDVVRVGRVNAVFLEIARELRYRNLKFVGYDRETERKLENIRSLSLGHHVRSLYIHPEAWNVFAPIQRKRSLAKMLASTAHRLRAVFDSDYKTRKKLARKMERMNGQIQLVIETMKTLEQVEQYRFVWPENHNYFYRKAWPGNAEVTITFLSLLTIPSFCGNLTKLDLSIPANTLESLALVKMPSLENFDISLLERPRGSDEYLGHLAILLSGTSATLQTLSISCYDPSLTLDHDFAQFFCLLCKADFPHLYSFHFHIWSEPLRSLAVDFNKFILRISHRLNDLKLCHAPRDSWPFHPPQLNDRSWISDLFGMQGITNMFSSLTLLRLNGGSLPINIAILSAVLSSVAQHLEELVLEDQLLTSDEVKMVVRALSLSYSPLRHLSIELKDLSPNIFDLLALKFPQLQSLKLSFKFLSSSATPQSFLAEDSLQLMSPNMPLSMVSLMPLIISGSS